MSLEDKIKATAKKVEGKLEAAAGELTGDQDMKVRGNAKQAEGEAIEASENLKDKARNLVDDFKTGTNDTLDNVKRKID